MMADPQATYEEDTILVYEDSGNKRWLEQIDALAQKLRAGCGSSFEFEARARASTLCITDMEAFLKAYWYRYRKVSD